MNIVEIIKASVGLVLVILLSFLAYSIITGNVTERNSYGLDGVFTIIGGLGTAYAMWAYRSVTKGDGDGTDKKA